MSYVIKTNYTQKKQHVTSETKLKKIIMKYSYSAFFVAVETMCFYTSLEVYLVIFKCNDHR